MFFVNGFMYRSDRPGHELVGIEQVRVGRCLAQRSSTAKLVRDPAREFIAGRG